MDDERAREGVEHLQRAAKEMIDAARAFLDVADRLVDDPASASSFADLVSRFTRTARRPSPRRTDGDGGDDDGPTVQRIDVS